MRARTIVLGGATALAVAMGIGRFAFTPILPMMRADAGVSVALGGWLAAANYVGYLVGALTAARLRWPAARAVRAVIAVTTLAMAVDDVALHAHEARDGVPAALFLLWLIVRGVAGVASAWVLVHTSAWAMDRLARVRRADLGGVVFAGVGLGIALAGAVCLGLMHAAARSSRAWEVLGALAIVLTIAVWRVFAADDSRGGANDRHDGARDAAARAPDHGSGAASDAAVRARDTLRLVVSYGAFGFGYIIPATFLPVMAREVVHDPLVFGLAWPLFGIAAALSPVLVGRWSAAAPRRAWLVAQLVMAFGVALPMAVPGLVAIVVAACAVGGTFMVVTMAGMQEARRVAGVAAPRLMAAMTASFAVGQILGPLSVTATTSVMGAGFAPALTVAAVALVAGTALLISRESRSRAPARTPSSTSPAARPLSPSTGSGRD